MRGKVTFDAGGVTYEVRYTTNRLCDLEESTGRRVQDFAEEVGDPARATVKSLRTLLAFGMGKPVDLAGEIIDEIGLEAAGELIGRGLSLAFAGVDPAQERAGQVPEKPGAATA